MTVDDGELVVRGRLPGGVAPDGGTARYYAAAPPDARASFTGSGLPHASWEQAMFNTPHRGVVKVSYNGRFEVRLANTPGTYYARCGSERVPPTLFLEYTVDGAPKRTSVQVAPGLAFRDLTYPASRRDAAFYRSSYAGPARSQEQILRASGYPAPPAQGSPPGHWGDRPPL